MIACTRCGSSVHPLEDAERFPFCRDARACWGRQNGKDTILTIDGECTRDPIFLFQSRQIRLIEEEPEGWTDFDGEYFSWGLSSDPPEDLGHDEDGIRVVAIGELCRYLDTNSSDCVISWWETRGVWLTREEAEQYGRSRHYNYPDGWRVYCHCANGKLTKALDAVRRTK